MDSEYRSFTSYQHVNEFLWMNTEYWILNTVRVVHDSVPVHSVQCTLILWQVFYDTVVSKDYQLSRMTRYDRVVSKRQVKSTANWQTHIKQHTRPTPPLPYPIPCIQAIHIVNKYYTREGGLLLFKTERKKVTRHHCSRAVSYQQVMQYLLLA